MVRFLSLSFELQTLMSVQLAAITATRTPRVKIPKDHFLVHVKLDIKGRGQAVQVWTAPENFSVQTSSQWAVNFSRLLVYLLLFF